MHKNQTRSVSSSKQFIEITLVDGHVLGQKCLEVEYVLAAHGDPVLVEGGRLDDLVLEGVVQILDQLQGEGLDDDVGGDAVDEELVQLLPGREEVLRTLVARNVGGQLLDVYLPVGLHDGSVGLEAAAVRVAVLNVAGFEHEDGPSEVAAGIARDVDTEFVGEGDLLLAGNVLENTADLCSIDRKSNVCCEQINKCGERYMLQCVWQ